MVALQSGIIRDQNDALKMGQWPISNLNTCNLHNYNGPFEICMGPLQKLMGPRILLKYLY